MKKHSKQNRFSLEQIYGNNKITCNNKIIVGEKFYSMFLTFFIFSVPYILSIVFFLKSGPLDLYKNLIYIIISSILYIIHIYSMLKGGCTDPGILPRQNKDVYYETSKTNMRYKILGHIHKINYCYSCYLFRPPRTSHCAVCDNCVERFDHHCLWLGTCIGKRNYKYFYTLLGSLNISAIFEIAFGIYTLLLEAKKIKNKESTKYTFIIVIGFIVLFNLLFLIIFIGKLFILHTYLVLKGLTFYEYSKEKMKIYPEEINPYNKYKFFSDKCILFLKNRKSHLLDLINKEYSENEKELKTIKFVSHDKKIYKKEKIKFIKEKKDIISINKNNDKHRVKIKYLNTYQEYDSSSLKRKTFGNNINIIDNIKKYTEGNDYNNDTKRTKGNITLEFNGITEPKTKTKNNVTSSESSKEIDFDKNINVVINPYCIIADKKKKSSKNKNNNKEQSKKFMNERNQNVVDSPFHEIDIKNKKIMFSNL